MRVTVLPAVLLIPAALLAAGAPAASRDRGGGGGEQAVAKAIGNRVPGPSVDCIDPHEIRSTQVIDGTAIVYDTVDHLYVQRPAGASRLRNDDVLVTRIEGAQLCRLDTIRLVEPVTRFQRGFVVLGPFASYTPRR